MAGSTKSRAAELSEAIQGQGGELHMRAGKGAVPLTTNQGVTVSDNQNSLRAAPRAATLIEDFILREKITHFDHERIPERVVHARGSAAHGHFELTRSLEKYTTAGILTRTGIKTPVFCRLSTVAGGAGSVDTPRDVRGFAVKFYTEEGNWDLVGNNIPVFFIQDAMKFPDLVHAVKMEQDRGFPQAASAHDTFWDFISLMPESMHMVLWVMSDRTLPRSLRMMEGFGVHSFRLIDNQARSTFVKFHWRPRLGMQSMVWDEACKVAGTDPDYHRRDLYEAIERGDFPVWDLAVQLFTEDQAAKFEFDHLDPTKLIPEEVVPLTVIGHMVLNRNPDNFFAETEQVAFCPANLVPGMDFSDDPLLQGRLFSYLDTQLSRLGGPNFHQLPVNAPRCPFANHQRDGHMQGRIPVGRQNYEPSTLQRHAPRESDVGFQSFAQQGEFSKVRTRAESFADHYSQARMFFRSLTAHEQTHVAAAFIFELSKITVAAVCARVLSHLGIVDTDLARRIAHGLGMEAPPVPAAPARPVKDLAPSGALRTIGKTGDTLIGRTVAILVDVDSDARTVDTLMRAVAEAGARVVIVAAKIGAVRLSDGKRLKVDAQLAGAPSVLYDAIALVLTETTTARLNADAAALDFVRDAYNHLKAIAVNDAARALLTAAGAEPDDGVVDVTQTKPFLAAARVRQWAREKHVRPLP